MGSPRMREGMMRLYAPLRPRRFAEDIGAVIHRAAAEGSFVDVMAEARRISRHSGVSAMVVAGELVDSGRKAGLRLEGLDAMWPGGDTFERAFRRAAGPSSPTSTPK
jgi:hypothetical protein